MENSDLADLCVAPWNFYKRMHGLLFDDLVKLGGWLSSINCDSFLAGRDDDWWGVWLMMPRQELKEEEEEEEEEDGGDDDEEEYD